MDKGRFSVAHRDRAKAGLKHLSVIVSHSNREEEKWSGEKKNSTEDKARGAAPRLVLGEATCTYPMIAANKSPVWTLLTRNKRGRSTHCVNEYKSGKKTP